MGKITYKIDRLFSADNILELGLKTGVKFKIVTGDSNSDSEYYKKQLQLTTFMRYEFTPTIEFTDATNANNRFQLNGGYFSGASAKNLIPNVDFVEKYATNIQNIVFYHLHDGYLSGSADDHISVENKGTGSSSNPGKIIKVTPLYTGNDLINDPSDSSQTPQQIHVIGDMGGDTTHSTTQNGFITGFTTDKFGKILKYSTRQVATSDLNISGTKLDNFRSWSFKVGNNIYTVNSSFFTGEINAEGVYVTGDATSDSNAIEFAGDGILQPSYSADHKRLTYSLNFSSNSFTADSSNSYFLTLKSFENVESSTESLFKIALDANGRVISRTAATASDIMALTNDFDGSNRGVVKPKGADNTDVETAVADTTYFLTSGGKWATIPLGKVHVEAVSSGTTQHPLLAASSTVSGTNNYTAVANNLAYITNDGTIHGTFSGNGADIEGLKISHLTRDSANDFINVDWLNTSALVEKVGLTKAIENSGTTSNPGTNRNKVLIKNLSGEVDVTSSSVAGVTGGDGTAVLAVKYVNGQVSTGSNDIIGWQSLSTLVSNIVSGEGGMRFMGVIDANTETEQLKWPYIEGHFKKGDFYKIGTISTSDAWNYAGYKAEIEEGDTLIAVQDYAPGYASNPKAYWSVIQGNLTNAVTADTVTPITLNKTYHLPMADVLGDKARTVQYGIKVKQTDATSGAEVYKLENAVANKATTLENVRTLWGQNFDGSASIGSSENGANIEYAGNITPAVTNTSTLGTSDYKWKEAWINTVNGNATTATEADHVGHSLTLTFGSGDDSTITFNGSNDASFTFNPAGLGVIDTITDGTSESVAGNVITGITLSKGSGENASTLTYSVTKGTMISSITSNIFSIPATSGDTTGARTISFLNSDPNGILAFWAGDTGSPTTNKGTLSLSGILRAFNVKVYENIGGGKMFDVARKRDWNEKLENSTNYLLVADSANGDYSFERTNISVTQNLNQATLTSEHTTIPTTGTVKAYVDSTATALSASTKVDCIKLHFAHDTQEYVSGSEIPAGAVVDHIDINIVDGYSSSVTFSLSDYNNSIDTVLVSTASGGNIENQIDVSTDSTGVVYSYKFSRALTTGNLKVKPKITLGNLGQAQSGSGDCYIYYTIAQRN